jgi:putative ABC transport system permease protein
VSELVERVLETLLGRLPIGWLQLLHNRTRLLAAVGGVTFANVLIFMQLGFLGALVGSIKLPYDQMNADLMISASDMNTLADGSPVPRQRMFEALGVLGVASASPLYYAKIDWKQKDGSVRTLDVFGVDPSKETFRNSRINERRLELALPDVALIDRKTRNVPRSIFDAVDKGLPLSFETRGRTLNVIGTFTIGGGFSADGYLIVSDQTFLRLFPQRVSGAPNHIFITLAPDADRAQTIARLRAVIPGFDSLVRTVPEAVAKDQSFQTTQRPVGLIFGFGIVIGVIVGVIIVYQVLATDVAEHMKEYATFKAIGYRHRFFLGIIFEEAMILAVFGFVPGVSISLLFYSLLNRVTGLPIAMSPGRATAVLLGTLVMCSLSGAIATQRLARANPAELF